MAETQKHVAETMARIDFCKLCFGVAFDGVKGRVKMVARIKVLFGCDNHSFPFLITFHLNFRVSFVGFLIRYGIALAAPCCTGQVPASVF